MSNPKLKTYVLVTLGLAAVGGLLLAGCSREDVVAPMNTLSMVAVGSVNGVPGEYCTTLFAGQTIEAGTVCAEIIDNGDTEELCLTYTTTDGWELIEAHTWVGEDLADMPQTRKGNPVVGNFPYNSGDISGQTTYTVCVDLNQFGNEGGAVDLCGMMLYAAAHAALGKDTDGDGVYDQTETGWGDGDRMVDRGNWATYFTVELACDYNTSGEETGETAFAFGCDDATCFLDFTDEDGTGFNRWGWFNGPLAAGTYYMDIYAGAGQCDLTKGTLVGLLTVVYDGATAVVTYETCGSYYMDEAHLYVGNEPLARDVNGEYTVAPGQYPYIDDDIATNSYTFTVPATGDIYVVAHAVVVGDYSQGSCGEGGCLPPGPPCDETVGIIYGMERFTGDVFAVDLLNGTATQTFSSVTPIPASASPNGLAYDTATMRVYYCDYQANSPGDPVRALYFWDLENGGETLAGDLGLENAAADMDGGKYYFIDSLPGTDDLYEVTFNADGTIATQVKLADISGNAHRWTFNGDIAVKDGILYGWGRCEAHGRYEYFTYDIGTGDFAVFTPSYQQSLQLAFGSNSDVLYGHRSGAPGNFYPIDLTNGAVGTAITISSGELYTDCASGQQCW